MKAKSNILVIIAIFSFTLSSCFLEDNCVFMPSATQSGKNTFGCKINGKDWIPCTETIGEQKLIIFYDGDVLQIQARLEKLDPFFTQTVKINSEGIFSEGEYQTPPPPYNGGVFTTSGRGDLCWNRVDQKNSKIVITRLDLKARIVSGTFEYLNMKSPCDSTDIMNITDGRFDMTF
jgi:hypothetical protein